jgi:hypothetical protein
MAWSLILNCYLNHTVPLASSILFIYKIIFKIFRSQSINLYTCNTLFYICCLEFGWGKCFLELNLLAETWNLRRYLGNCLDKQMFLKNTMCKNIFISKGALVSALADDTLHLWNLRQKRPAVLHSLKFCRER